LGLDAMEAAWAIHDLANASMAAAIRVVTVQRGIDPRRFAVVAFGGAGPLHACRLADTFGIDTVVVPWAAGVASAIGLLSADLTVHRVRAVRHRVDGTDPADLEREYAALEAAGRAELHREEAGEVRAHRQCDVRHIGQAHQLTIDVDPGPMDAAALTRAGERFRARYRTEFGIELDSPLEIVHLRVTVSRVVDKVALGDPEARPSSSDAGVALLGEREAWFPPDGPAKAAIYDWSALPPGSGFDGPAIVQGADTTVLVPRTRRAGVDAHRNLVLTAVS
jgi:N-methylhydantoinase A